MKKLVNNSKYDSFSKFVEKLLHDNDVEVRSLDELRPMLYTTGLFSVDQFSKQVVFTSEEEFNKIYDETVKKRFSVSSLQSVSCEELFKKIVEFGLPIPEIIYNFENKSLRLGFFSTEDELLIRFDDDGSLHTYMYSYATLQTVEQDNVTVDSALQAVVSFLQDEEANIDDEDELLALLDDLL